MTDFNVVEWFEGLVRLAGESVTQASLPVLLALFAVSGMTEIGMPFPFVLDGVLFYAGYDTTGAVGRVLGIMTSLFLGRVAGASTIYWLSRATGTPFLRWLGRRSPRALSYLDRLKAKLGVGSSLGVSTVKVGARLTTIANALRLGIRVPGQVAVARLTPGLLTAASVASGVVRIKYWHFILGIFLASLAADGTLILSGVLAGLGVKVLGVEPSPWVFAAGLTTIIALTYAIPKIIARQRANSKQ